MPERTLDTWGRGNRLVFIGDGRGGGGLVEFNSNVMNPPVINCFLMQPALCSVHDKVGMLPGEIQIFGTSETLFQAFW